METKKFNPNIPTEIIDFIQKSINVNVQELALKKNPFPNFEWKWIINQIAARQKALTKLPTWCQIPQAIFPSTISVEQTTSEIIAQYKSQLFTGKNIIDLTGGLGVDSFYFSKQFEEVIHCEWNKELSQIAAFNFKLLKANNISCIAGDSLDFLKHTKKNFDYIYIDPARRDQYKNKVFLFEDCTPNIIEHMDLFLQKAEKTIIKSSPLVDLHDGISQLKKVSKIYILAYKNEVKELLWILENKNTPIEITAINIANNTITEFSHPWKESENSNYSLPQNFLYEPFSAVMKTGLFHTIAHVYNVEKIHQHSHLYTSKELVSFPGRKFSIVETLPFSKKEIKKQLEGKKMNISTRNFPLSVEEIRKKFKIKEGGDTCAFFTTNKNEEKIVILTTAIRET